ncbi:Rec8 like protein-domain-containing protein [Emericellopsis atlantica]|uniref:Rec8 like protein-domain-containing protein n=1 Tax=Emericellopsis atlantica TaxID=2614577 RepID=A0A9P8CTN2_9HYPO|nr:Rec8 like protein-domain-containing protein [Emericellopsis atlantica]KAG9258567.1 Rec8 like protein-domain-containing protein [Emericellopsis atlantica]
MFYSHEILTNPLYGVSTIWMVATVGKFNSRSSKVNRKSIQEVNVPKACETIINPGVPLALRLQGNLLYGVSRVFSQQCGYVLSDCERTQTEMLSYLGAMNQSELDPKAGQTKRQNIVLADDPNFDPVASILQFDMKLFWDADQIFGTQDDTQKLSNVTPLGSQDMSFRLPASSHSGSYLLPPDLGFDTPLNGAHLPSHRIDEDLDPFGGSGLEIDENGNVLGFIENTRAELPPLHLMGEDEANTMHHQLLDAGADFQMTKDRGEPNVLIMGEQPLPSDAEGFPAATKSNKRPNSALPPSSELDRLSNAAPNKRRRAKRSKKMPTLWDDETQISRIDLKSWQTDYLARMEAERAEEEIKRLRRGPTAAQSKAYAEHLVWGRGLFDCGAPLHPELDGPNGVRGPLADMFSGRALKALCYGEKAVERAEHRAAKNSSKRRHEDAFPGETPKTTMTLRQSIPATKTPLRRHSSMVAPWSRPGSAVPPGSSIRGSAQKGLLSRPVSRTGSAIAPIERHSDLHLPSDDFGGFGSLPAAFSDPHEDIELNGESQPAKFVDADVLDWVKTTAAAHTPDSRGRQWFDFENAINSQKQGSKQVAAQAFLNILTLATRAKIVLQQEGVEEMEPFGAIRVGVAMG